MIYMIRAGDDGPIKIGFTASNIKKRLSGLQTSHSQRLSIFRLFEGDKADEKRLHTMFADLRRAGEWFNFSRAMLGDVGLVEISLPSQEVVAPPAPERADDDQDAGFAEWRAGLIRVFGSVANAMPFVEFISLPWVELTIVPGTKAVIITGWPT